MAGPTDSKAPAGHDQAETVVLVHGAGMNAGAWDPLVAALTAEHFALVALDLTGHGASTAEPAATIDGYVADVVNQLDGLGISRAAVVGHSMGASIALSLAATAPTRVTKLAMIGAGLKLAVNDRLLEACRDTPLVAVDLIVKWSISARASEAQMLAEPMRALFGAEVANHPGTLHSDFAAVAKFDGTKVASSLTCPTLVISGEDDVMTPPDLGRTAASVITGAGYLELPATGHMVMTERPADVSHALRDFLRR